MMAAAQPPTLLEVRDRLRLSFTAVDDVELNDVLWGELESQAKTCVTEPYSYALRLAVFRRCARSLAAKGVPLGILADEFGQTTLQASDAEILRLEGPYMRFALGGTRTDAVPPSRADAERRAETQRYGL